MNKAFVREPDQGNELCPRCGTLGRPVTRKLLGVHLPAEAVAGLSEFANFCPFPTCEVAYFDAFDRVVLVDQLLQPVWPKDPDAQICRCFGLTADDIDADIAEGGVTRCRAAVEKAKSPEARCASLAADGQSCVPEIQRYYMKHRQP